MRILAIETSCDETAVSILDASGSEKDAKFAVLGNALYSQAKKHAAFGGVYPNLAKREHAANLVPLLVQALKDAKLYKETSGTCTDAQTTFINDLLTREEALARACLLTLPTLKKPPIDAIAVTHGPGLEPALWVGVNFARTLALIWDLPIIPVNHLEGHLLASAVTRTEGATQLSYQMQDMSFPVLGLIVSGGHTEFVHASAWGTYTRVGGTRDDSIGEAFDKVARMLDLPYPGGPELSRLATRGRPALHRREIHTLKGLRPLPRPMINSGDLDFSFSGIKTAVKYQLRDLGEISDETRAVLAADFEDAVTEVVLKKTTQALSLHPATSFMLGGGVSANAFLRAQLTQLFSQETLAGISLLLPAEQLSTDNAVMIGMAGYFSHLRDETKKTAKNELRADGNLSL